MQVSPITSEFKMSTLGDYPKPSQENSLDFWQQLQEYRDYLYRCCVKWMNGNAIEAEDALSRAIIKAWEKIKQGTVIIENFKAWLTQLTYNLCIDIHRKRSKNALKVENFDTVSPGEEIERIGQEETPFISATRRETAQFLLNAIDNLPPKLREVFVLIVDQELSYQEIAQHLNISYDNVRQRISKARKILQEQLREYEAGEQTLSSPSAKPRKYQKNTLKTPIAENVSSFEALEKQPVVARENSPEAEPKPEQHQPALVENRGDMPDNQPNTDLSDIPQPLEIQRKSAFSIVRFSKTKSLKLGRMPETPTQKNRRNFGDAPLCPPSLGADFKVSPILPRYYKPMGFVRGCGGDILAAITVFNGVGRCGQAVEV